MKMDQNLLPIQSVNDKLKYVGTWHISWKSGLILGMSSQKITMSKDDQENAYETHGWRKLIDLGGAWEGNEDI